MASQSHSLQALIEAIPERDPNKAFLVKAYTEFQKMKLRDDDFCRRERIAMQKHVTSAQEEYEAITGQWVGELIQGAALLIKIMCGQIKRETDVKMEVKGEFEMDDNVQRNEELRSWFLRQLDFYQQKMQTSKKKTINRINVHSDKTYQDFLAQKDCDESVFLQISKDFKGVIASTDPNMEELRKRIKVLEKALGIEAGADPKVRKRKSQTAQFYEGKEIVVIEDD